jgi:hypothetical protein
VRRGAIVADDIHLNPGFARFMRSRPDVISLVAQAADAGALFAIVLKGL